MKNCIFLIADLKFYRQISICLRSIVKNYPHHPDIIICPMDMSEKQKSSLSAICPCIFLDSELSSADFWPLMESLSDKTINPLSFWSRFLIWKSPLFLDYDYVLYLDSDTVIIKPLDDIFEQDFYIEKDLYNWDNGVFFDIDNNQLKHLLIHDGLELSKVIANAWVFCVSRQFRTGDEFNDLLAIKNTYKNFIRYADQSVLNLWILKKNIKIYSKNVFNFQYAPLLRKNYFSDIALAHIIHFNWLNVTDRIILMYFYFLLGSTSGTFLHMLIYCPFFLKSFTVKAIKYVYKTLKYHLHA